MAAWNDNAELLKGVGSIVCGVLILAYVICQLVAGPVWVRNHPEMNMSNGWWLLVVEIAASIFMFYMGVRAIKDNWPEN